MRIRHSFRILAICSAVLALAACSRIGDDWKSAQAADTTEAYQQFLKQHADSEFAAKAQERVKQLSDDRDWQGASGLDTKDAYEQFVAQHADSKWAPEARARLDNYQAVGAKPVGDTVATATSAGNSAGASTGTSTEIARPGPPEATKPVARPTVVVAAKPDEGKPPAGKSAVAKSVVAKPASKPLRVASITPAHGADHSLDQGVHFAQLGAYSSHERAEKEWQALHARLADELGKLEPHYTTVKSGSQLLYRLQVGLASKQQVLDLCSRLKKQSLACIPASG